MHKKILAITLILMLFAGCRNTNKQFIIYRGVESGVKSMSYSIDNKVLTIFLDSEEIDKPQDYVYKINSNSSFDTVTVSIDGKEEAFNTIFVQ